MMLGPASSLSVAVHEQGYINDLQGGQAQTLDTNLSACERLYTSHLFAGNGLTLD